MRTASASTGSHLPVFSRSLRTAGADKDSAWPAIEPPEPINSISIRTAHRPTPQLAPLQLMTPNLTEEQLNLLVSAKDKDNPVVVDGDALETAKSILGERLDITDPGSLPLAALAAQYDADDTEDVSSKAMAALSQQPETGGATAPDLGGVSGVDALAAAPGDAQRFCHLLDKSRKLETRIPKRAREMREEAATLAGVDPDGVAAVRDDLREQGYANDFTKKPA